MSWEFLQQIENSRPSLWSCFCCCRRIRRRPECDQHVQLKKHQWLLEVILHQFFRQTSSLKEDRWRKSKLASLLLIVKFLELVADGAWHKLWTISQAGIEMYIKYISHKSILVLEWPFLLKFILFKTWRASSPATFAHCTGNRFIAGSPSIQINLMPNAEPIQKLRFALRKCCQRGSTYVSDLILSKS